MERLTAGPTAAARKCLLITRKIIIPPPDSGDPPDGPLYFAKKWFAPWLLGPTSYIFARKEMRPGKNNSPTSYIFARKEVRSKKNRFAPLTAGTH